MVPIWRRYVGSIGGYCRIPEAIGLFASAFKEQHVGLDALGVEDADRQAQQGVDVACVEQISADRLAGTAFEQDVVGYDDGALPADLQQRPMCCTKVSCLFDVDAQKSSRTTVMF